MPMDREIPMRERFISRSKPSGEIAVLQAALWQQSPDRPTTPRARTAVISGEDGIGKSALARDYMHTNRDRYAGAWWIHAGDRSSVMNDLIALGAQALPGLADIADRGRAAGAAVVHIAHGRAADQSPWLMVYDGVSSPEAIALLTPSEHAHVLITTQISGWSDVVLELPLDRFSRATAATYLSADTTDEDPAAAGRLADALACHPLALALARATCRHSNWTLDTYREHVQPLLDKAQADEGVGAPLTGAVALALQRAGAQQPDTETLMGIAAYLAPDRIPLDIIGEITDEAAKSDAVATINAFALANSEILEDGTAGFSVHPLVQAVIRNMHLDQPAVETKYRELATRWLADAYPGDLVQPDDPLAWPACRLLEQHVNAILRSAAGSGAPFEPLQLLLERHAQHLKARGETPAAEALYQQALSLCERQPKADHAVIAGALRNLGGVLMETGRPGEAEPHLRRAVQLLEQSAEGDPTGLAHGLSDLADVLKTTGRSDEAEPLMRRALSIDEAALGPNSPIVALRLSNLGMLLRETGRYEEADDALRRALALEEECHGNDHPNVAVALGNLAVLLDETRRGSEAEPLLRRALAIDEKNFGATHPNVAIRLSNLAALLQETGRLAEAEPLMRRALAIDEAHYGATHPEVAGALNNLALLLCATQRAPDGEPLMRRAVLIADETYGADHPTTVTMKANHAKIIAAVTEIQDALDAEEIAREGAGAAKAISSPTVVIPTPAPSATARRSGFLGRLFGRP